jgi:hypothetical protein
MDIFESQGFGRFDTSVFGLRLNFDQLLKAPRGDELTRLGLTSFLWPPEQAHRDYIARVTDPKLETQALALFTLARHETRHFHDLLISPYGAALMREFTNLARLALACRQEILTSCSTIILPVTEWASDWQLYRMGDASVDEPPESVKELAAAAGAWLARLRTLNGGVDVDRPYSSSVTSESILEGLAILLQQNAVKDLFGPEKMPAFMRIFQSREAANRYYGALNFVAKLFQVQPPTDTMSIMLFASLFGDLGAEAPSSPSSPKELLTGMADWIGRECPQAYASANPGVMLRAVNAYFKASFGESMRGMAIRTARANQAFLRSLLSWHQDNTRLRSDFVRTQEHEILLLFVNYAEAHEATADNVTGNPFWYLSKPYFDHPGVLPNPIIYLESNLGVTFFEGEGLEKLFYIQGETRLDLAKIDAVEPGRIDWDKLPQGTKILRRAHRLAPLGIYRTEAKPEDERYFPRAMPNLDLHLWHHNFDSIHGDLRILVEGFDGQASDWDRKDNDWRYAFWNIKVYSNGKLRKLPSQPRSPEEWDSDLTDPVIRARMKDKDFLANWLTIRERNRQRHGQN